MNAADVMTNPTVRRLPMALLAGGVVVLNKKLGSTSRQSSSTASPGSPRCTSSVQLQGRASCPRRGREDFGPPTPPTREAKAAIQAAVDAELQRRAVSRCRLPPLPRWRDERRTV